MTLYSLRSPDTITKFDTDGNVEASYSTNFESCTCPAGHRPTCRHRQMLPYLRPLIDTQWFLDWDGGRKIVDFNGMLKSNYDAMEALKAPASTNLAPATELHAVDSGEDTESRMPPLPAGVTMYSLDDLETVHNAIADAVGEPRLPAKPWRRM